MRERGPLAPLEQRCVRSGYWVIEGYDVKRFGSGSNVRWIAEDPTIKDPVKRRLGQRYLLDDVRFMIREKMESGRS